MGQTHATVVLPRRIVLQSRYNSKYLSYTNDIPLFGGCLNFSGKQVVSIYAKYEVEPAKSSANKGLVHIRCSYNNKYWRRRWESSSWIGAFGDEPNENHSDWKCTLFEPLSLNGKDVTLGVRFRTVHDKKYASMEVKFEQFFLVAESKDIHQQLFDVFTVIDWDNLLLLPKYIAFKGDNGKYLTAAFQERHEYLQFSSDDIGAPGVGNEVFITNNGNVIIKSNHYGKFWRRSPNWIWADTNLDHISTDPSSIDDTKISNDLLFKPIRLGEKEIALKNLGNNYFCKRLTTEGKQSCLNAGVPTISREARLEVLETVVSRDIYNVDYRLLDSRIYNQTVITMATGNAVNGSNEPNTVDLKLRYTDTKTGTWNTSVSLKLGAKISFEAGIPQIFNERVELSSEFTGTYTLGEAKKTTQTLETTYKVIVPAKTRISVSMIATQGSCNVPYSYTQCDTLTNGQQVTYYMDDGVYTGRNSYNFKYETKEEPL